MNPARSRSQSSAGTIRAGRKPPRSASDEDDDDEDDEDDTFFDFGVEVATPTSEYPQRLEELLAAGTFGIPSAGSGTRAADGTSCGGVANDVDDDNRSDGGFFYNGKDGPDPELQAPRRAEWGLGVDQPVDEKELLRRYGREMRDVLGEEQARAEDEDAGELEVEGIALQENAAPSSERSTTASFSSAQRGFSEHLSPNVGASPSLATTRKASFLGRPAFLHPTVSRLRSHNRHASTSSVNTLSSLPPGVQQQSGASSHFSQLSRSESSSTINSVLHPSSTPGRTIAGEAADTPNGFDASHTGKMDQNDDDPFRWSVLQRISFALYPPSLAAPSKSSAKLAALALGQLPPGLRREHLGRPTKMVSGGLICVGTSAGWVGVWDFRGEQKGWFGNEIILKEAGAVTALELTSDHTYIAVGHASGHLYLYHLGSAPSIPARSVAPIQSSAIRSGRKEGHLEGTRILHVGFVGKRHTAIVSGDERGMAFYHSLGRVLGVDSTDVLRILGSYPDPTPPPTPAGQPSRPPKRKAPTTLFAATPLPLALDSPHPADTFQFSALLTPAKLVIVGLKPSPRTWFRRMRAGEGGNGPDRTGTAVWRPAQAGLEPTLAFSWGHSVRFVKTVRPAREPDGFRAGGPGKDGPELDFVEDGRWEAKSTVLGMQWQSSSHLLLATSIGLEVVDVTALERAEYSSFDTNKLVTSAGSSQPAGLSVYKGKTFLLTTTDVRVAAVLSWTDRILALMEAGEILGAIRLTTSYYLDFSTNTLLGLPKPESERKSVVGGRLRELLQASVRYTFSEDRMTDGTHVSTDGRGVDRTTLFEGLVTDATAACLALDDLDLLFDDVFEQYQTHWIDGIFCRQLEPFIVDGRIRTVPTQIAQKLLELHDADGELGSLETLVWNLDPACLDINQAIGLCRRHRLWDALIYVFNRALLDYVSPVVHLIGLIRTILEQRSSRPARLEAVASSPSFDHEAEELVPDAYKIFAYLSLVLTGSTYPTGEAIPEAQRVAAQTSLYAFLLSRRPATSPTTGDYVLTSLTANGAEPDYPYLRLLLLFDTESLLHALDIAFEDSFLNEDEEATHETPTSRQTIVQLLLEVMASDAFSASDGTMLHIFVARNLPKYPQFLQLPRPTLHGILSALTDDPDQSTREDRELAVEYLLSTYTPEDRLGLLPRFEAAGFYRILRSIYLSERRWPSLINAFIDDPEADDDVFPSVEGVLRTAVSPSGTATLSYDLQVAVIDVVPRLADISVRQVAALVDAFVPSAHEDALARLANNPRQQYGYLRTLIEPMPVDQIDETTSTGSGIPAGLSLTAPSTKLPLAARNAYIGLLCEQDPGGVVPLLSGVPADYFDLHEVARVCESAKVPEAVVWALNRVGRTKAAFERVGRLVDESGASIANRFLDEASSPVAIRRGSQTAAPELQDLRDVTRVAVEICLARADGRGGPPTDIPLEDMWFKLLHPLLDLVHSVSASMPDAAEVPSTPTLRSLSIDDAAFGATAHYEPQQPSLLLALQSLVQESLAALVTSSSDTNLSFPPLFKRLLDGAVTDGGKARGSYGQFRAIITGMLDTYRQEAEMVAVTNRLLEQDVFEALELQTAAVGRGWRAALPTFEEASGLQRPALLLPSDSSVVDEPPLRRTITFRAYRNGDVERLLERESPILGPGSAA